MEKKETRATVAEVPETPREAGIALLGVGDNRNCPPSGIWTRSGGSRQMEAARSLLFVGAVLLGVTGALGREGG